jgi:hypothetical protein
MRVPGLWSWHEEVAIAYCCIKEKKKGKMAMVPICHYSCLCNQVECFPSSRQVAARDKAKTKFLDHLTQ